MPSDTSPAATRRIRAIADLPGPRGWPLFGNAFQLETSRAHMAFSRWADEFGKIYRFRAMRHDMVVVSDVEIAQEVLRDRPDGFRRREALRQAMQELGVEGVFGAEGDAWRRQRKLAMHALNTNHLREFFDRLEQVTERLQRRWHGAADTSATVDAQRDLMRFTVDVTSGLAFGTDLNTLEAEGDTIQRHLDKLFPALARRLLSPFPYWRWFKLPVDRELDVALVQVLALVNSLVADARGRVCAGTQASKHSTNFLDTMVASQSAGDAPFTDAEVVGNTLTMLLAGEDTTANTLAWMMDLLADRPDVQQAMRAEADRVLGDAPRPPDYASTEAMPYIEAVALEAMRLKPVAPLLALEPNSDRLVGDVLVPKGTAVILLTAQTATSAENFSDPKSFRPERWMDPSARTHEAHNTRAFVPFGAGPRFCPGRHVAMLEIKMVAAMLCRNFDIARAPGSLPAEEVFSFTMMPKGVLVTLRHRQ
jgi:cytochrome P450